MSAIHRVRDVAHPIYGAIKIFDDADTISRTVAGGREWEPQLCTLMAQHVVPGTDVLDIGANLGLSALGILAHGATPRAIHCFEPQPDVHALLQHNVAPHELVRTYAVALGWLGGIHGYQQVTDNIGGTRLDSGTRHYVASMALDALLAKGHWSHAVSVMKIDVETHEGPLLLGAVEFFKRQRPMIFIEIVDDLVPTITAQLDQLGYVWRQHLGGWDYWFVPREQR